MLSLFILFGICGCFGELVFTALCTKSLQFKGHSNLWVFALYGLGGPIFYSSFWRITQWNWLLRAGLYGIIIISIEYLIGRLLCRLLGSCPWEYASYFKYIRLDYFPIWCSVGLIGEFIYKYIGVHI